MRLDAVRCEVMRTTITIDEALHAEALAVARERRVSLSELMNEALRSSLRPVPPVEIDPRTGLGVIRLGRPISSADVAAIIDDE